MLSEFFMLSLSEKYDKIEYQNYGGYYGNRDL